MMPDQSPSLDSQDANKQPNNGRYQLHEEIGRGGMGVVYQATDRLTGQPVALKQIKVDFTDPFSTTITNEDHPEILRLALAQEFQLLAGLRHPNIVSVLDYGFDDHQEPFFTMDLLTNAVTIQEIGRTLDQNGQLSLITQALQALSYLHRRDVLHKDIKPSNMLVSNGRVHLVDFGLSAADQQNSPITGGTASYMAPEIYHRTAPYSAGSDLYSLGLVMHQLLSGIHRFDAPTSSPSLNRPLFDANLDVDEPQLPQGIGDVLQTLLQKDPQKRYRSAQEALAALNEATGQTEQAQRKEIRESYLQAAKFVGRQQELETLSQAVTEAQYGQGSAWLIGGESGVGKTRLINELRTLALVKGFIVLHGQAKQERSGLPYQLWHEPLRHALVTTPHIDDLTASVLIPLVPDIGKLIGHVVEPAPEIGSQAAQHRLHTAIATLLSSLQRPILLILEDLHWARDSLLPISYLATQISQQPIIIVGNYRNDEQPKLPDHLPNLELITLKRLTPDMMAELSIAILGEDVGRKTEVLNFIQKESEGNAFFTVEIVRALAEEVGKLSDIGQMPLPEKLLPNGIQDIVQNRLSKLPDSALALLRLMAVAGRELELPLVHALADGLDVDHWWLPLCAENAILEVYKEGWQFSHGKIRDGILAQMEIGLLKSAHQQIALAIETLYPNAPEQTARLTDHWSKAGNTEKEGIYAQQAGEFAANQFAHEEAISFFSIALERTPADKKAEQYNILLAREAVYASSGIDRPAQRADLDQLTDLADALNQPQKQAMVALKKAQFFNRISQYKQTITIAEQAITKGELAGEELIMLDSHVEWGYAARMLHQYDIAQYHLELSVNRYRTLDHLSKLGYALNNLGILYSEMDQLPRGTACLQESLEIAQKAGDIQLQSRLNNNLSINFNAQGDLPRANKYLENALTLYQQSGNLTGECIAYVNVGINLYRINDYQTAERNLVKSIAISRKVNSPFVENLALFHLCLIADRAPIHGRVFPMVEDSIQVAEQLNLELRLGERMSFLGFLYQQQQQFDQAGEYFEKALAITEAKNQADISLVIRFHQARLAQEQQQWNSAADYYRYSLELIEQKGGRTPYRVAAQSGLASILFAKGDLTAAVETIEPVISHLLHDPLVEGWHDMRITVQAYQILGQVNDPRGKDILKRVYQTLQTRVQMIEDKIARQFALEQVPEHREIVRLYNQVHSKQESSSKFSELESTYITAIQQSLGKSDVTTGKEPKISTEALLSRLLATSNQMSQIRSLQPLLSYAIGEVLELVGAERGYIVLINENKELEYRIKQRRDGTTITSKRDPISHSILNEVVRTQESIVVGNALLDPRFAEAESVVAMRLRSIMCAPLITKNKIVGAIYVENRSQTSQFIESDLIPLEFFSNQAAVAIENAYINENLESLIYDRTKELAEAKETAEAANEAKTSFLSNMSHELRTPLNVILNFSYFVREDMYGEANIDQKDAMQRIMNSGQHLLSLINDVLDINKIEAGMMNLMFEEINAKELLNNSVTTTKGLLKKKNVKLVAHIPEELPVIEADRRRSRQILLNIVSNAAKYTNEGEITITAESDEDHLTIIIVDTGIGIPESKFDLIFQRFAQAHNPQENITSSGLGLAITKELVEMHHGKIWFESKLGKGSTFYVQLPVKQPK